MFRSVISLRSHAVGQYSSAAAGHAADMYVLLLSLARHESPYNKHTHCPRASEEPATPPSDPSEPCSSVSPGTLLSLLFCSLLQLLLRVVQGRLFRVDKRLRATQLHFHNLTTHQIVMRA